MTKERSPVMLTRTGWHFQGSIVCEALARFLFDVFSFKRRFFMGQKVACNCGVFLGANFFGMQNIVFPLVAISHNKKAHQERLQTELPSAAFVVGQYTVHIESSSATKGRKNGFSHYAK